MFLTTSATMTKD